MHLQQNPAGVQWGRSIADELLQGLDFICIDFICIDFICIDFICIDFICIDFICIQAKPG